MEAVMPGFMNANPRLSTREFYQQICKDLLDNGLGGLSLQEINALLNISSIDDPHITKRGIEFLDYIKSPLKCEV